MSKNSKIRQARRAAQEERQAKNVIKWLAAALLVVGAAIAVAAIMI